MSDIIFCITYTVCVKTLASKDNWRWCNRRGYSETLKGVKGGGILSRYQEKTYPDTRETLASSRTPLIRCVYTKNKYTLCVLYVYIDCVWYFVETINNEQKHTERKRDIYKGSNKQTCLQILAYIL